MFIAYSFHHLSSVTFVKKNAEGTFDSRWPFKVLSAFCEKLLYLTLFPSEHLYESAKKYFVKVRTNYKF